MIYKPLAVTEKIVKTKTNTVMEYITKEEVEAAIDALGKGASVRGETLTLEEFARLSDLLSPYKKG